MARKHDPTDEEILAQLPAAMAAGRMEPLAERVFFDSQSGLVFVDCRFAFRPEQVKGLENATADQLANVELLGGGESIYWPELDEGASVADLAAGAFGDAPWIRHFAARGGRARSPAKTAAVRENGKKGGRPARNQPPPATDEEIVAPPRPARRRAGG